ncbi:MAG: ATP-binding protein [Chlamydiia bacterium]|nr:ATP-binding protein [Chlamydiia bacterium]
MLKRFFIPPKGESYFLFGPRGTGKTTWLQENYPAAYWVDLNDPETFRMFSAAPEKLQSLLAQEAARKTVVIDEVQKVPELLNVVHGLIEEKRGLQFVLTGSSARKLKQQGVNLLGGRAFVRHMPPFFAQELGASFHLEENLRLGMLPIVLDSSSPKEVLRAYAGLYLKEEVQAEGIVRNVGDFARFLETMSFSHAGVLNASNIARECHVARKTVDAFLLILEDLLLSFRLEVFRRKAKRALSEHAKFYYFDAGVFASLRPQTRFDVPEELEGGCVEGLVAQHLKGWAQAQIDSVELAFWRTTSKLEVDFIVSSAQTFVALEVKNGAVVHPADLHGLEAFREDYPEVTPILLYRGKHKYKEKGILCCPIEEYLLQIHPHARLPEE